MIDRLWAGWRIPYVENDERAHERHRANGMSLFEGIEQSGLPDEQTYVLWRGERCFALLNAFPYTSGHLMVAPFHHTPNVEDLDDDEMFEVGRLIAHGVRWLKKAYDPQGFNIGANIGAAGGAGIPSHVHWHIVPRWSGDTNFMTTVGDVRVLPQSLQDSYDLLRKIVEEDAV